MTMAALQKTTTMTVTIIALITWYLYFLGAKTASWDHRPRQQQKYNNNNNNNNNNNADVNKNNDSNNNNNNNQPQ